MFKRAVLMKTTMTKSSTFYKDMFRLALPIVCQNLITTAVGSADVIMLGWVSQTALSAGSLASQIMFILNLVYSGISSPSTGAGRTPGRLKRSWGSA